MKIIGFLLGILLALLISFHFWFQAHARQIIEHLVETQTNGKVKLKIGKLRFSYFSNKIEMEKVVFYNTDTLSGSTATRFSVDKMKMQVKAILPIVFNKRLLIDSLTLFRPHIQVTRLRARDSTSNKNRKDVSIPEEVGKIYASIQEALQVLDVKRFQIDDGTFILINKIVPGQLPITISNLHFHIDNLYVANTGLTGKEKLLFSDNMVLRSSNQDILFPDGRHRLSFSKFRINLQKRLVEFDSCTIAATRGDSTTAAFRVFFDALLLTNIDFDTLYNSEVIKADSVYCINPKFNLDVQLGKKKGPDKPSPKLGDIIKQLTGDLQLGFVVVNNADFNIKTIKDGNPSSFTFSNNNFEMQGLSVEQDAAKPIKVKSFVMAIRNYENFLKDSSYSIKFDSILFDNDQITLSNFLFNKLSNGKISNTFSMPRFSLRGLSWDELVFERRLKAEQVMMFRPFITYTAPAFEKKKADRKNIFQSLGVVNEFMDLKYLDIVNGTIDLKLKNHLRVQLDNADVSVQSNSLLNSTKLSGIKNSLTRLKFRKGNIQAGKLTIELNDIRFTDNNGKFDAGSIQVYNKEKKMAINLQEVAVEKMQVNEITGAVFADGVNWQKGHININAGTGDKKDMAGVSSIELRNVRGAHTTIHAIVSGKTISTNLDTVSFTELLKKPAERLILDGLAITGNELRVKDNHLDMSVSEYAITDNKNSTLRQIKYKNNSGKMDAGISIPSLTVIPHVQPLLNGVLALDAIHMVKPVITIHLAAKKAASENKIGFFPKIDISEIKITQPSIHFTQASDSVGFSLAWQGEKASANFLLGNELHTQSGITSIGNLKFYLTDFIFTNQKGKIFTTGNGNVSAQVKNIGIKQKDKEETGWEALISSFDARDFRLDSLGKSKGNFKMNSGSLNNLSINSASISDFQKLAASNTAFQIKLFTGNYVDNNNSFSWHNAGFNRLNKTISLDSFSFSPTREIDSFLAKKLFQTDYITFKTGAIRIGPVDIDHFISKKTLPVGTVTIDDLLFTDYKDKKLPFRPGLIKPLPVNLLKNIPQQFSIDTLLLNNAQVDYTETGEKTKLPGTITVNRMTVRLISVKNYNHTATDSLSIQANGYLMDTAWIRIRVKESYTDTSGGFQMTLRMKPVDLNVFNTALVPLTSVKIVSGLLDTLSMRAIGREYLSFGEMKMYYHNLKVRFLNQDDEMKKTFRTRLKTFIANNFVIKNKNTSRTGQVFFIRDRERSAINYLIKIATSGMASSVGISSNRKMLRNYKRELTEHNLPPIDFE